MNAGLFRQTVGNLLYSSVSKIKSCLIHMDAAYSRMEAFSMRFYFKVIDPPDWRFSNKSTKFVILVTAAIMYMYFIDIEDVTGM